MGKLQSYKNSTSQVRIDIGLHKLLKIKAAKSGTTIRTLLESCLAELLGVDAADLQEKDKYGEKS